MNQLVGKGFYIWKIPMCENGDPTAIANSAFQAGLSHVLIKIANGIYDYNYDSVAKRDLVKPVALALKEKGVQVWGWQYVYGDLPDLEAQAAIRQIERIPLDGFVIDAETEYKDKYTSCRIYRDKLRAAFPNFPIGLSSFRYPKLHPQLPWKDFLIGADINMPQVYWEQAHNPGEQLQRCFNEFQDVSPVRTIIPTGAAYGANDWRPTSEDIIVFLNKALQMNISAINFYSWDYCRNKLPDIWQTISNFSWPTLPNLSNDLLKFFFEALNNRDFETLSNFYHLDAVHITSSSTIQGTGAIKDRYIQLLNQTLSSFHFETTASESNQNSMHFHWLATSNEGITKSGEDTFGFLDGKIIYHYSSME